VAHLGGALELLLALIWLALFNIHLRRLFFTHILFNRFIIYFKLISLVK